MMKLDPTYNRIRQNSIAAEPVIRDRSAANDAIARTTPTAAADRVSLSDAGLSAAARYSNLVQRAAAIDTPALPAPETVSEPSFAPLPEESPISRNLVRQTYAQRRDANLPGSQLNILA